MDSVKVPETYPTVEQALRVYRELRAQGLYALVVPPISAGHVLALEVERLRAHSHLGDWGGEERKRLAAEVKRLRTENKLHREAVEKDVSAADRAEIIAFYDSLPKHSKIGEELEQLRAKLARVEALPAKWRKDWDGDPGDVARQCALELEAALITSSAASSASDPEQSR